MLLPFHHHGILGLNARNLLYLKPFNPKKAIAFADDKMKTKAFLSARGVPTAKLFARIDSRRQLRSFDFSSLPDECVLKPNEGFGGEGIIILKGRRNGEFLEQGKKPITAKRMIEHIEDILDGKFSVNGKNDAAFFEQILVADDCFTPFRPAGLPDIRIVVFNLVPVMGMLRIPTPQSGGKANVHLGGIGIGIDIAKGITTHAAQYNGLITELSHGQSVAGIAMPKWNEMLLIASKIQYATNIGFLAVDMTLDANMGPVLLEVNARAGLMVQVANLAPLRSRLERVGGLRVSTPEKGVRLAQELFGEKRERPQHLRPSDKIILSLQEIIGFTGEGVHIEEPCSIAIDQTETVFSTSFIEELLKFKAIEPIEGNKRTYRAKFTLKGQRIQTIVTEGPFSPEERRVRIGQRDLSGFLIDPAKTMTQSGQSGIRKDLHAMDRVLASLDSELSPLKYLKPVNLTEERVRLESDVRHQPVFKYRRCDLDLAGMERTLKSLEPDDTPIGILLRKKCRELLLKIDLIRARGDTQKFQSLSLALYGSCSPALIGLAQEYLKQQSDAFVSGEPVKKKSAEEVRADFEDVLSRYGLHDWVVSVKRGMVADCAVGEKHVYLRDGASFGDEHLKALFAHEIETHALTAENGVAQPYEIFRRGCANYLDTQEGLAVYNQNRVLPPGHEKRLIPAKSVLAVSYAMDHSFADTRNYLEHVLGFSHEKALTKSIDVKRGFCRTEESGAFTKSLVYFRGLRAIEHFVKQGGDLKDLYIGKIAIEDLPLLATIEGIRPALILPEFLRHPVPVKTAKKKPKVIKMKIS